MQLIVGGAGGSESLAIEGKLLKAITDVVPIVKVLAEMEAAAGRSRKVPEGSGDQDDPRDGKVIPFVSKAMTVLE